MGRQPLHRSQTVCGLRFVAVSISSHQPGGALEGKVLKWGIVVRVPAPCLCRIGISTARRVVEADVVGCKVPVSCPLSQQSAEDSSGEVKFLWFLLEL